MVVSPMAYVALHDRLVLGSSSAIAVGVLVDAVSLPLVLERISRVGVCYFFRIIIVHV